MKHIKHITPLAILMAASLFFTACDTKNNDTTDTEETEVAEDTVEEKKDDAPIASPRKSAEGSVAGVNITVDYGSPAVKDRKIWGGLEEYDVVWRAGANEATSVAFSEDVMVAGNKVEAGKYGLYMIPKEEAEWVVIFNTDWDREKHGAWGAYNYTEDHDVLRVNIAPEWVEENQERLAYSVTDGGIAFAWEKARLTIPVSQASGTE